MTVIFKKNVKCSYTFPQNLSLPSTIDRIESEAFVDAFLDASHSSITCYATTPPSISPYAFGSEIKDMTLYVPRGSRAAYMANDVWMNFGDIIELPYNFKVGKIYYRTVGANSVRVVNRDTDFNSYSGEVTIPWTFNYKDVTYHVVEIGNDAFYNCSKLTKVEIPSSVTEIGNRAFRNCPMLTSITIPEYVESIGTMAFDGCDALNEITCLATTPPAIYYETFTERQYKEATLYVPYGCKKDYWFAYVWEQFHSVIELITDEDAINEIAEAVKDEAVFDLSGRKVEKVTQPGIYIKRGKKVMIK